MSNCSLVIGAMMSKQIWSSMGVHSCELFLARDIIGIILWLVMIGVVANNIQGTAPDSQGGGVGLLLIGIMIIGLLYALAIIWDFLLVFAACVGICILCGSMLKRLLFIRDG